ncbi:MAG TPA: transcription termination/antitermination NusG family protein [Candidatus Binatia bacterium]
MGECSAWYVVRSKPRAEAMAATNLRVKGIEVYLPRLARAFPHRTSTDVEHLEPLFPGYLFARLDLASQFHVASWTPGVAHLLSLGQGLPTAIDDGVIEALRERAGGGEVLRARIMLRPGDPVEIRHGPFAGLHAIIDRPCSGAGRVQILLDLLRRQTRLELPASAVAPL